MKLQAVAEHEVAHALTVWALGGEVESIDLHMTSEKDGGGICWFDDADVRSGERRLISVAGFTRNWLRGDCASLDEFWLRKPFGPDSAHYLAHEGSQKTLQGDALFLRDLFGDMESLFAEVRAGFLGCWCHSEYATQGTECVLSQRRFYQIVEPVHPATCTRWLLMAGADSYVLPPVHLEQALTYAIGIARPLEMKRTEGTGGQEVARLRLRKGHGGALYMQHSYQIRAARKRGAAVVQA